MNQTVVEDATEQISDEDLARFAAALPQYELGHVLGHGSTGVVLTARHTRLDRIVAVKALPRAFAVNAEVRSRFLTEARVLASFDHPHIVPIYDFVESGDACILVMEHMPGGTVWTRFAHHGFRFEASVAVALSTAIALDYAHQRGVLHRDIKPDNLLFSSSGAIKVTDFGLAKVMSGQATMITRTGQILGTPAYIAPEQALGEATGKTTDVYSLGVLLFELLSGDLPFHDDGHPVSLLMRHVSDEPMLLGDVAPDVPAELADTVMRALNKDPEKRYSSAWEFASALAEVADQLWGPDWLDRAGVPVELPPRLVRRASLRAMLTAGAASGPLDPSAVMVQSLVPPSDSPRRSNRAVTADGRVRASSNTVDASVQGFGVDEFVPVDAYLGLSATPAPAIADPVEPDVAAQEAAAVGPAGWYEDPWAQSPWRWWDGAEWTSHTG